jgi:hypothetical protein
MILVLIGGVVAKRRLAEQTLVVAGKEVRVTYESVPIKSIRLDPCNPRIRFQLERSGKKTPTQSDLQQLIKSQSGYDGLQKTIRVAGGIHDPIIVRHDGIVVEGNTRTTVISTLHAGQPSQTRWHTIPIVRLPKDVPEQAIAMLMASYHVAGKNKWAAFAKADQVYRLVHHHSCTPEQIANETRNMTKREVEQTLEAYEYLIHEVMPSAGIRTDESFLESKWSHALEFVKNRKLGDMKADPGVRKTFAKLLASNQIKGAEVRRLPNILKNKRASKVLHTDGFKAAEAVLRRADPTVQSIELRHFKNLTSRIGKMKSSAVQALKSDLKAQQILAEHSKALHNLMKTIGMKVANING